jgi:hypothetical protein
MTTDLVYVQTVDELEKMADDEELLMQHLQATAERVGLDRTDQLCKIFIARARNALDERPARKIVTGTLRLGTEMRELLQKLAVWRDTVRLTKNVVRHKPANDRGAELEGDLSKQCALRPLFMQITAA